MSRWGPGGLDAWTGVPHSDPGPRGRREGPVTRSEQRGVAVPSPQAGPAPWRETVTWGSSVFGESHIHRAICDSVWNQEPSPQEQHDVLCVRPLERARTSLLSHEDPLKEDLREVVHSSPKRLPWVWRGALNAVSNLPERLAGRAQPRDVAQQRRNAHRVRGLLVLA